MSSYELVNTIQAPTLVSATQPDLIKFETNYAAYVERVEDINVGRTANQKIKAATIRQCIKPKLLHSLCILKGIEGATKAEEETDEAVEGWFHTRLQRSSRDLNERVEEAIAGVQYVMLPRDPAGSAKQFVLDIITALDEHNASEVVTEADRCKQLITKFVHKVQPPDLKQLLRDQMNMWTAAQKSDLTFFANNFATLPDQVHAVQSAAFKLKRKHNKQIHYRDAEVASHREPAKKKVKTIDQPRGMVKHELPNTFRTRVESEKQWAKPCLNSAECDGVHPIRKCPNTSEAKHRKLPDQYWAQKKNPKKDAKISSIRSSSSTVPNENDGRYMVLLNDVEEMALGDSGADFSTISSTLFAKILEKHPKTVYERFEEPMNLETAVKGGVADGESTASGKTCLALTIILPGTGLPVRIHDVEFLVADKDMAEVLLGRLFLKAMGFDLSKHLQNVGRAINGMSEAGKARLCATVFNGMKYQDADDDPMEPPKCLQAGFGNDWKETIDAAVDKAVKTHDKMVCLPKECSHSSHSSPNSETVSESNLDRILLPRYARCRSS